MGAGGYDVRQGQLRRIFSMIEHAMWLTALLLLLLIGAVLRSNTTDVDGVCRGTRMHNHILHCHP